MKRYGQVWKQGENDAEWTAQVYKEKYTVHTYGHGYDNGRYHYNACTIYPPGGGRMYYNSVKGRDNAMKKLLTLVKDLRKNGPMPPDQLMQTTFNSWPTLYRTRNDVLAGIFFGFGNNYHWCAGNIIIDAPESHIKDPEEVAWREKEWEERFKKASKYTKKDMLEIKKDRKELQDNPGPHPDVPGPRENYDAQPECLLKIVPDNISNAWLPVVYEAALLLRDRSGIALSNPLLKPWPKPKKVANKYKKLEEFAKRLRDAQPGRLKEAQTRQRKNAKIGKKAIKELEQRFGDRLKQLGVI